MAAEVVQLGGPGECVRGQVHQPGTDDRPAPPHLGHLGHVDVVLVVLGVAQRRGLRVRGLHLGLAHVGVLDDGQPLGDGGHHAVLDAVVDHLDEVTRAAGAAVQVPVLGGPGPGPARGGIRGPGARGDAAEDRVQVLHRPVLAADHQAEASLQAEDPAGGADVHVVQLLRLELLRPVDVVPVVGVAAVDHDVTRLEQPGQLVEDRPGDRRGQHQPGRPGLLQLGHELLEGGRAGGALTLELLDVVRRVVIGDDPVAVAHQPPGQVGAHPAQPDHAQLHRLVGCHEWFSALTGSSAAGSA